MKVAKVSEIEEGGSKIVDLDGQQVALFKVGGAIYAVGNTCPHSGGPLGEGYLDGSIVTCPWHGWQFDVKTGDCQTVPQDRIRTYPVEIQGDDVVIKEDARYQADAQSR